MQALLAWLADAASIVFVGSSPLERFLHPLEVSVGANMAYAIVARTGNFQGARLKDRCNTLHQQASDQYEALKAERPEFMDGITMDANKDRCDSHVGACLKRIAIISKWFAFIAVIFGMISVVLMIVAGISPDYVLPNWFILLTIGILLAPVPVGLGWTFDVIRHAEAVTAKDYQEFFHSIGVLKAKFKKSTIDAIEAFDKKLAEKRPGIVSRLLMQIDLD